MMEQIFEKLRSLQEVLSQKFQVEQEVDEIPKALATKTELLNRLKQSYIQKNNDITLMKDRVKGTGQKVAEAERGREQSEQQMDLIKTQREYEALDKEIKDATEKEQNLRKDLQEQQKLLEEMQENLEKEETLIQRQEEEVKSEQSRIKHETKEKAKDLVKLEKEESKITPGLDEEILFKFERIIRSKAGIGIVPTVDEVCTGCHMILTPEFINEVRRGQEIHFCPYCSRILYFEDAEEATPSLDIFNMPVDSGEESPESAEEELENEELEEEPVGEDEEESKVESDSTI